MLFTNIEQFIPTQYSLAYSGCKLVPRILHENVKDIVWMHFTTIS